MYNWKHSDGKASPDEERAAQIRALLAERRGYEVQGKADRVKAVDVQLRALGHAGAAPAKRSEKRPARKSASR